MPILSKLITLNHENFAMIKDKRAYEKEVHSKYLAGQVSTNARNLHNLQGWLAVQELMDSIASCR